MRNGSGHESMTSSSPRPARTCVASTTNHRWAHRRRLGLGGCALSRLCCLRRPELHVLQRVLPALRGAKALWSKSCSLNSPSARSSSSPDRVAGVKLHLRACSTNLSVRCTAYCCTQHPQYASHTHSPSVQYPKGTTAPCLHSSSLGYFQPHEGVGTGQVLPIGSRREGQTPYQLAKGSLLGNASTLCVNFLKNRKHLHGVASPPLLKQPTRPLKERHGSGTPTPPFNGEVRRRAKQAMAGGPRATRPGPARLDSQCSSILCSTGVRRRVPC
ncbi:hypothetical protein BKA18_005669 [Streptomyces auratus]